MVFFGMGIWKRSKDSSFQSIPCGHWKNLATEALSSQRERVNAKQNLFNRYFSVSMRLSAAAGRREF